MPWSSLVAVLLLALVHITAGRLRFLDIIPRSRWLSLGSGISVAYVFLHVLPELAEGQRHFSPAEPGPLARLEREVWLLAMLGLGVFYGLERLVQQARAASRRAGREDSTGARVFWLHLVSFGAYNAIIGSVLQQRESGSLRSLALFTVAMAAHFVVNDYGLRLHHKSRYQRVGRWLLAGALVAGWLVDRVATLPPAALAALFAFIAGGVVLNVLKEELPSEREAAFWAFALGAVAYAVLLLLA